MLVALYLVAIVAANLSVAHFGPASTIVNAFLFIGLDITTRDMLHERWEHKHLWWKMAALIAGGSLLSWILNRNAGPIAVASLVAFAASGLADTIMYHLLRRYAKFFKVNGSNVVSSAVDSVVFPTLAFGAFMPWIAAGQFVAKVAGGFLWSLLLNRLVWHKKTAEH
ncbi:MAG TPA: VUT family protein [Symbiobacteriaceae bacterium]|nr:VUT family protein [Symbiobacteriaceae bacterium]